MCIRDSLNGSGGVALRLGEHFVIDSVYREKLVGLDDNTAVVECDSVC